MYGPKIYVFVGLFPPYLRIHTYYLTGIRIPLDGLLALDAEQLDSLADVLHYSRARPKKVMTLLCLQNPTEQCAYWGGGGVQVCFGTRNYCPFPLLAVRLIFER